MNVTKPALRIESATERDVPVILRMIKGLAEYERLGDYVIATEEKLRATLFGPRPAAEVLIGYDGSTPVGFALFFQNYSTFLAQPGIYLEDLFVVPEARGHGYGRQLLAHLARIAGERSCGRLEWSVLDWNEPAINFYRKIGADILPDWRVCRMDESSIARLADSE